MRIFFIALLSSALCACTWGADTDTSSIEAQRCNNNNDCPGGTCLAGFCNNSGAADTGAVDTGGTDTGGTDTAGTDTNTGCTGNLVSCGGSCVDTQTSTEHCGACGQACATGESCTDGSCGGCTATECGGDCVDTQTSNLHCGSCDNACTAPEACDAGTCACPSTAATCGGVCTDIQTDENHCGGCDIVCPADSVCNEGQCRCANPSGDLCSPSAPNVDSSACNFKTCEQTCTAGFDDCNSDPADGCEVEINADTNNCGFCGTACSGQRVCCNGTCEQTCP